MGMCCEKKAMTGWRNVWCMKWWVPHQEVEEDLENVQKDCQAHKLNREVAMDCSRWRMPIKDDWWSGKMWMGECFFWYRLTQLILNKGCKTIVAVVVASHLSKVVDFNLRHLHFVPCCGWPHSNFAEIIGIRKLASLGYRVDLLAWS